MSCSSWVPSCSPCVCAVDCLDSLILTGCEDCGAAFTKFPKLLLARFFLISVNSLCASAGSLYVDVDNRCCRCAVRIQQHSGIFLDTAEAIACQNAPCMGFCSTLRILLRPAAGRGGDGQRTRGPVIKRVAGSGITLAIFQCRSGGRCILT